MLKGKLSELFDSRKNILMAYLAGGHRGDPDIISICLCLGTTSGANEHLSEAVHSLFAQYFNRTFISTLSF